MNLITSIKSASWQQRIVYGIGLVALLFLAFYNLTSYPVIWYDEGSHLHVPKTLVNFGEYADRSSEGFRYYGPTVGVGPSVMLPLAASFKLFGIGLLQARVVMSVYLLLTIFVFFGIAFYLGGEKFAWVATALMVTSRGIGLLEYGRQVLGEVPGMLFMLAALWIWLKAWDKATWRNLLIVGLLAGLATITKNQYLLVLAPAFGLAWLVNLVYYRLLPGRFFIVPAVVMVACYALWQIILIFFLGPSSASENLHILQVASSGAAFVFSPDLMKRALRELLGYKVFLVWLVPALLYGFFISLPRKRENAQWGMLWIVLFSNLSWYVLASISWLRYAFPGLVLASLFVARFFGDLTNGFEWSWQQIKQDLHTSEGDTGKGAIKWGMRVTLFSWLGLMILIPLGQNLLSIVKPPENYPQAMAAYLDANIPEDALIETWEPEMGFLTDHNYHFPPQILLDTAVGYIWRGGPAPSEQYDFTETMPDYVLDGAFANYVNLYDPEKLAINYDLIYENGPYRLYKLNPEP